MKSKTVYLIIFLITLIIIIIVVQILRNPNQFGSPIPPPSPSPNLRILLTNISNQPIKVNENITIRFNKKVNNETLVLQITPEEEILPLFNPSLNQLTIEPINTWKYDTSYTIKVLKTTKSADNNPLDKDYEFNFKTEPYTGI